MQMFEELFFGNRRVAAFLECKKTQTLRWTSDGKGRAALTTARSDERTAKPWNSAVQKSTRLMTSAFLYGPKNWTNSILEPQMAKGKYLG